MEVAPRPPHLPRPLRQVYVDQYAKDEELFFKDFADAFGKLMALGVPGQAPA